MEKIEASDSDAWGGPTPYEKELTKETFTKCVDILVNLPFEKTEEEETEPNMITIRNKNRVSQHPCLQIMRENDQDNLYWASGLGHVANPKKLKLPEKYYTGKYMIEMSHGSDPVLLDI